MPLIAAALRSVARSPIKGRNASSRRSRPRSGSLVRAAAIGYVASQLGPKGTPTAGDVGISAAYRMLG